MKNSAVLKQALLSVLRQEMSGSTATSNNNLEAYIPPSDHSRQKMLGDILIASNTPNWRRETLDLLDQIWHLKRDDTKNNSVVQSWTDVKDRVVYKGTTVAVHKGDITQLKVDAIVNAANDAGLGCFVPDHKCIDNVVHREAGPRLRMACRDAMAERNGQPLAAGVPPIVTPSFALPHCDYVLHVTGPQVIHYNGSKDVSIADQKLLAKAYWNTLTTAANHNIQSIAFPCISTGLFGFPNDLAAEIALDTVHKWIHKNPGQLDAIVMDVFTPEDEALFLEKLPQVFQTSGAAGQTTSSALKGSTEPKSSRTKALEVAKSWIDEADAVLIVAGAGMSVKQGEMVYTNCDDFRSHYPWFVDWGYKTAYEAMRLASDRSVPESAKWAFWAKHMDNMRWSFTPNDGYKMLQQLVKDKDTFVMTSNVDACFERSGFPAERIYTPQGEWTYLQCLNACRPDSFFEAEPYLSQINQYMDTHPDHNGHCPDRLIPKCPNCGGNVFGNVRGGSWFLHHEKYQQQNKDLQKWMSNKIATGTRVVVLELGAGFNTPTVTRFPAEAFTKESGGKLIRINPSDPEVPADLSALSIAEGWQVLDEIANSMVEVDTDVDGDAQYEELRRNDNDFVQTSIPTSNYERHFGRGGFSANTFLKQLAR